MKRGSFFWHLFNGLLLIILSAAALEFVLRLAGIALMVPSDLRNRILPEDAKKVRILAIGESTTADYFSSKEAGAWPRRLEKKLRDMGINARVYNEGVGGTTTPVILSRVSDFLEMYHPHIVISMMGINDDDYFLYRKAQLSPFNQWLSQIRLVRVANRLTEGLRKKISCHIEEEESTMKEFWTLVDKGFTSAKKAPLENVEKEIRWWTQDTREVALLLAEVGVKLDESKTSGMYSPRSYYDRAFELYPYHKDIAFRKLHGMAPGSPYCLEISAKLVQCGEYVPDIVVSAIAACARGKPEEAAKLGLTKRGFFVANQTYSQTKFHYRKLHEILKREKIHHIAMQYPTRELGSLQGYFDGPDGTMEERFGDILFVSNERNFKEALKVHTYEKLFIDRFQNNWGHTSALGHEMIAEAVLTPVIQLIKDNPQLASHL